IAIFMKRGVGLGDRREERPAVAIGQEAAARRPKCDIGLFRELDAERLPVEPAVEDAEARGVDIAKQSLFFEHGVIAWEALDLFDVTLCVLSSDSGAMGAVGDDDGILLIQIMGKRNDVCIHRVFLITNSCSES